MRFRQPQKFKQPIAKVGKVPPPESVANWWHPSRTGVRGGPPSVERKLAEVDPKLAITWNAYANHWSIWLRTDRVRHKLCWGWQLLFNVPPHQLGDGSLVMARLYSASNRAFGSAKHYFDALMREEERDKEKREQELRQDSFDRGWDFMLHQRPTVGYGSSNGSKTARFG
jgi:hypothetical protein